MIKWKIRITKWHPNFWKKFEAEIVFLCSLFLLFSLAPTLKAGDVFEPNDSFETATLIEEGEIEATIDPVGDLDYFKFNGLAGRAITIDINARTLFPPSLLDSVICLYDASEIELVCNDDYGGGSDSLINFTLPTDGIYYIKVVDYNGAGGVDYFYVLKLSGLTDPYEPNDNFETATPINLGDVIFAIIGPAGDLDYFKFNGIAGQTITINIDAQSLKPPSLLDSVICLYDASKAELVCNNDYDGPDSLILNFKLPKDGIYYIKVEDSKGAGGQDYFYILRLLGITDVYEPNDSFETATPIKLGDVISAVIAPVGDLDYFQFNGSANQKITINIDARSLKPPSWLYARITLYDANKNWLASDYFDWWTYEDPQILYTLPRDGIYYIRVEPPDWYGQGGENYFYILRLTGGIHDVTVSNRTDSGVTISWWTHGNPVTGVVNYGTTTALGSTATDNNLRENGVHYVNITGLTANTQYFFEVVSGSDKDDNNGQYYTFMTAKVPQEPPESYSVFGYVYKDWIPTPAPHSIKYFWLSNAGGESSLLSALTKDKGYWLGDLSKAKSDKTNDVFPFAAGDTIYAYAHFGAATPGGSHKTLTSSYIVSGVSPQELGKEFPLAVELASFTAVATVDGVTLNWRTISEINNLGFNVYRGTQRDGKYVLVNAKLIGGAGTDATPHDYSFTDENVKVGQTYYYYIEAVDFAGKTDKSDIIEVTAGKQDIKKQFVPPTFALLQNYPNPFNPETWIPFKLAQNTNVVIRIYSAKGQLIRAITLGNQKAGDYVPKDKAAYWDGRDSFGEKVASGVYFYTIQAGEFSATRKMIMLK